MKLFGCYLGWLSVLVCLSVLGCGGDKSPEPQPTADTVQDTGAPVCTSDAECPESTLPCVFYSCTGGQCVPLPIENGTACEEDPCMTGQQCSEGVCDGGQTIAADCQGAVCGEDACGNSCGTCDEGSDCVEGACLVPPEPCGDIAFEGCCMPGEGVLKYCEDGVLKEEDCAAQGAVCTWAEAKAFYACGAELMQSPDPAFGYLCPGETCEPNCENKTCGSDGCGGSCGSCDSDASCEAGQCVVCSCDGLECGQDACGNPCGDCTEGSICVGTLCQNDPCNFTAVQGCCKDTQLNYCDGGQPTIADCGDAGCGWDATNNWYDCGFTDEDPTGEFPKVCYDPDQVVSCESVDDCAMLPAPTCQAIACTDGVCAAQPLENGTSCEEDPCWDAQVCTDGACGGGTPVPSTCGLKECGFDACGNSCGVCELGFDCDEKKGVCEVDLPTTYSLDVQPILLNYCAPCHTEQKLGQHNIAVNYADAAKVSVNPVCNGATVGACSVQRIKALEMPIDAPGSVPPDEIQILTDWLAEGMLL